MAIVRIKLGSLDIKELNGVCEIIKEIAKKWKTRIVEATRKPAKYDIKLGKYIETGASPRASIALFISSKAHALIKGRGYVVANDVKEVAYNCLRHRLLLNFEGEAEGVKTETIVKEILDKVPIIWFFC